MPDRSRAAELAAAIEIGDDDDLTTLTNLLVAVDLLDTDGVSWSLPDVARRFLVTGSAASMVDLVRLSPGVHAAWPELAATLRAGGPSAGIAAATVALYPALVEATAATQHAVAVGVAGALAWGPRPVIVDLGCGSGAWLTALLDAAGPGSTGIGVDLPHVVESVRPALADHSVTLVGGDYLDATLQVDRGDVVVLAHVLRAEPESRRACPRRPRPGPARSRRHTPGGRLLRPRPRQRRPRRTAPPATTSPSP